MWQVADFLITNQDNINQYIEQELKQHDVEKFQKEVAFNCMTRIYETWISVEAYIFKQNMQMLIER